MTAPTRSLTRAVTPCPTCSACRIRRSRPGSELCWWCARAAEHNDGQIKDPAPWDR